MTQKKTSTATPKQRAAKRTRAEAVKAILENVEKKMTGKSVRATLGDYIKLIQLSKELSEEETTEIKVTWVERENSVE